MTCDTHAVRFAFYGRIARIDVADTDAERQWQRQCCSAAAADRGGQITAWFFDAACPADMPFPSRSQGRALLAALNGPVWRIDAVVAADATRLLPRQPSHGVPAWLDAWHTPLLLADTGITISSPLEFDLIAGILLDLGRPPRRGQGSTSRDHQSHSVRRMADGTARHGGRGDTD